MKTKKRKCITCGEVITGRSDKIYCSDNCRSYNNNLKFKKRRDELSKNHQIETINRAVEIMHLQNSPFLINLVYVITQICKILSTFGVQNTINNNKIK